jgi:nicotinamide riboside kinase
MKRRINFFGGAGCGKSTISAFVFYELKIRGYNVEHVTEYIKTWAHQGRFPKSFDQLYIFGKQMHKEDQVLHHVDRIVTDCPLLMCCVYAKKYEFDGWQELLSLSNKYDLKYPPLNIFLSRTVPYQSSGRFHTLEESMEFDRLIKDMLDEYGGNYHTIDPTDKTSVIDLIESEFSLEGTNG